MQSNSNKQSDNEFADIDKIPLVIPTDKSKNIITLGDMHGNSLKLAYHLLREGVWGFEKKDECSSLNSEASRT